MLIFGLVKRTLKLFYRKGEKELLYFDICALLIQMILLFTAFYKRAAVGRTGKKYLNLIVLSIIINVLDIAAVSLDNAAVLRESAMAVSRYAAHAGYLVLRNIISFFYIEYLLELADAKHMIKHMREKCIAAAALYGIVLIINIVNFFTPCLFSFPEEAGYAYTRGPLFPVLYINAAVFVLYGLGCTIKFSKLFKMGGNIELMTVFPINIIAVIFQAATGIQVEMFANALVMLLIATTMQRPEETLDTFTGVGKHSAYASDMKRSLNNNKHVQIAAVNIANYNAVLQMIGFDSTNVVLRGIADKLTRISDEMKADAEIYYLDRGRFRCVFSGKNTEKAAEAAGRINSYLRRSITVNSMEINLLGYVCLVKCPQDISDFKTLMSFGSDFHEKVPYSGNVIMASDLFEIKQFSLSNDLDRIIDNAIANRKFQVYYQPIFSTEKKKFLSAEALLRLFDDVYGFISPDVFIAAAEKSGAIHRIGEFVLEEVCRFISSKEFSELGLDYIEINLSIAQCMERDLAEKVTAILKKYNVTPDKINLEITETAASYSQNIMATNIDRLVNEGISFSLDDFGTGYSNIKRVASLPLSIVKLDKSFVETEDNPRLWLILCNTIKMLKDMDMEIVVEGVETKELAGKLSDLGCEYIQGYYYSRPVPEKDFVEFIKSSANCA